MKSYSFIITILLIMFAGVASAQRMTVNVSMANIRSGPGTNYEALWKVEKYHPVHVIKKSGSWYQFRDFEGDNGWIFKDLVRDFPSVIVIKNKCNVRSGPGSGNEIVMTVEKGVPFKVTERKGTGFISSIQMVRMDGYTKHWFGNRGLESEESSIRRHFRIKEGK